MDGHHRHPVGDWGDRHAFLTVSEEAAARLPAPHRSMFAKKAN